MAYHWLSGHQSEIFTPSAGAVVPLTSVSSNERLIRTYVNWYIDCRSQDSAILGTWLTYGVVSLLQWTEGEFPVTPQPIAAGDYDSRDILHSRMAGIGWGGMFNNAYRVPGGSDIVEQDARVARDPGENAGIVWWVWGLGSFSGAGVNIGYWRLWWRVLVERDEVTP